MPTLYLWQINDITSVGPDVFSNTGDGNGGAVGVSTFSIDAGATTHAIDVTDNDSRLENLDGSSQDISTAVSFNGSSFSPGDNIQVEYSYIVRPVGSSDPADNVTVYAIRMDNTVHGVASDGPLVPGVSYDVLTISSNSPSVDYSSVFACFGPGTLIDTPDGPRPVDALKPGDLVSTLDHGPRPVRWTHTSTHSLDGGVDEDNRPVLIKAGALACGRPARDLIVSPHHRILVGGARQLEDMFENEALVPAKSLSTLPGIRFMKGKTQISWFHFACDRHEVVLSNGCFSESLLLGPMIVNGLPPSERRALVELFKPGPSLDVALNGLAARECLTVGSVKRRLARHLRDKRQHLASETRKRDRDLAM